MFVMDTRFLESFVIVAEKGSIAEAARRLNLTAAAVAQQLRALEQEIGNALVVRAGRTVRPTPAGLAILAQARNLVRDARDLRAIAAADMPQGELRLGAIASALTGMMPQAVSRLEQRHSQITLHIRPGSSVELYHLVVSGEIDAAILIEPHFTIPKSCAWHPLREEPLILIAPPGMVVHDPHDTLTQQAFVRYDRNHWGGQMVDRYLIAQKLRVQERLEIDALDAIVCMVNCGLGVSIVPDWAPPWPADNAVQKFLLPRSTEQRTVGLLWGQASPRLALVQAFVQACKESLQATAIQAPSAKRQEPIKIIKASFKAS